MLVLFVDAGSSVMRTLMLSVQLEISAPVNDQWDGPLGGSVLACGTEVDCNSANEPALYMVFRLDFVFAIAKFMYLSV